MKKFFVILLFLFFSGVAFAQQSPPTMIRIVSDAPIYSMTKSGGQNVMQHHDFEAWPLEDFLLDVQFKKVDKHAVALADQQIESSGTTTIDDVLYYKVGLSFYVTSEFVEVVTPVQPEPEPGVEEEGDSSDSSPTASYVHACAKGVCFEKLNKPMNLEKVSNPVGNKIILFEDHESGLIIQAETCLTNECLSVDERRNVIIGLVAPDAQDAYKKYGIPASITIAQAILETGWGRNPIIKGKDPKTNKEVNAHNFFGIKARNNEASVLVPTHEIKDGKRVSITASFRRYNSLEESIDEHGEVLVRTHFQEKYLRRGLLGRKTNFYNRQTGAVLQYIKGIDQITQFLNILQYQTKGNTEFTYSTENLAYVTKILNLIKYRKNRLLRFDTFEGFDQINQD